MPCATRPRAGRSRSGSTQKTNTLSPKSKTRASASNRPPNAKQCEVGGTGLGLTICKNIVESHGENIPVISVPNHRTTFSVLMPLGKKPRQKMKLPPDTSPQALLILKTTTPWGEALCHALARKGARIAIQYPDDKILMEKAMRIAAQAATRKAIALPLQTTESLENPDAARQLVNRVIDDFGRLDTVLYPADHAHALKPNPPDEGKEAMRIAHLLRAAEPHLRRSKPRGHFTILLPPDENAQETENSTPPSTDPKEDLARLAARCAISGSRPSLNIITLPQKTPPPTPEETAELLSPHFSLKSDSAS